MKIGDAIKDALDIHNIGTQQERKNKVLQAFDRCPKEEPELIKISDTHYVACHLFH
jgi:hypothetical protein